MSTEKSLAIVLRRVDFSETSLVLTLYTRDFGKIGILAKGARRAKNSFDFALDLLAVCRVVFLHKSSTSLDLLTEAKLEHRFRSAARDVTRLYAAMNLAELLTEFTEYGDPCPDLFDAAYETLQAIDRDGDAVAWTVWFQWALLQHTGQRPALDACAVCGTALKNSARPVFGMQAGGLLCESCRVGQRHQVRLRQESLQWLLSASQTTIPGGNAAEFISQYPVPREIHVFLQSYLVNLIGHPLKTQKFLQFPS